MRPLTPAGLALAAASADAAEKTVTLQVDHMTCSSCGPIVKKSLVRVAGVSAVAVSMENGTATVTFDDAKANVEALVAADRAVPQCRKGTSRRRGR